MRRGRRSNRLRSTARICSAGHGGQVLVSERTKLAVGDADLQPLGLHRLKDLTAPEPLYQVGDLEFPPLKSLNQSNLPLQPTPFVGREKELGEVLALLRQRLDAEKITYEYLDGKTRDREARVARFQDDPSCSLFLLSLKAGGVGLNLTAAEYVFLLDPWWNPAVEMQAIDRTHRIGQSRPVFAYRLVARETVEERILELQAHKRALADAILDAGTGGLRGLQREDLEALLA